MLSSIIEDNYFTIVLEVILYDIVDYANADFN